ncbi:hypothetical protein GGR51DRAFT_541179 [Nemania sp. FL0031]|nr:hypothetical protein GGR51DRAFT_541179 [Nemania sp. FL0031]
MEETSPKQTTTNETNLNNTNIGGNTHISINLGLGASGLEWDKEAFPGADKSRVIEYLMKGGQKTVEHSQQLHSLEHYSHPPRYVTDIKAALSIDPWAVKEPEGFEHQWGQIEALVLRWHEDKCGFPSDCIRGSGDDPIRKLEMWMGLYNPVAVQASFWQIWVEGMRQARQARQAQQEPKSD